MLQESVFRSAGVGTKVSSVLHYLLEPNHRKPVTRLPGRCGVGTFPQIRHELMLVECLGCKRRSNHLRKEPSLLKQTLWQRQHRLAGKSLWEPKYLNLNPGFTLRLEKPLNSCSSVSASIKWGGLGSCEGEVS